MTEKVVSHSLLEILQVNDQLQHLPAAGVIPRLEFVRLPPTLIHSVLSSQWFVVGDGRMILEFRDTVRPFPNSGEVVYWGDIDDCFLRTSEWHNREFELLENNPSFQERGVSISKERAKQIYELSKIVLPGKVTHERRYTPLLNLILLTNYINRQEKRRGSSEMQIWDELRTWREIMNSSIQLDGEEVLENMYVDPQIEAILMSNPLRDFVYQEFIDDLFQGMNLTDTLILVTRGKIEGPLGQVYKVHTSGLVAPDSGNPAALVVYTNDLKAEAIMFLMQRFPRLLSKMSRFMDDNPHEILPCLEAARANGHKLMEIIQVGHPGAKRRNITTGVEPDVTIIGESDQETNYSHYVAFPEQSLF